MNKPSKTAIIVGAVAAVVFGSGGFVAGQEYTKHQIRESFEDAFGKTSSEDFASDGAGLEGEGHEAAGKFENDYQGCLNGSDDNEDANLCEQAYALGGDDFQTNLDEVKGDSGSAAPSDAEAEPFGDGYIDPLSGQAYGFGETVEYEDGVKVEMTNVTVHGEVVTFEFKMTNESGKRKGTTNVLVDAFYGQNTKTAEYWYDPDADILETPEFDGPIPTGKSKTGSYSFEIPEGKQSDVYVTADFGYADSRGDIKAYTPVEFSGSVN